MRHAAFAVVLLLAATASAAAPTVTSIEPNTGFVYTQTRVIVSGTGFSQSEFRCQGESESLCPVAVVFVLPVNGTLVEFPGTVVEVSPTHIEVLTPVRPHGTVADVKVRVQGNGEAVVTNGFRWDSTALSNNPADFTRFLVPVTGRDLPGANGSLWSTEWVVFNPWDSPFAMIWDRCLPTVSPCPGPVIPASQIVRPAIYPRGDGTDGAFVYVPKAMAGTIGMSLRVRDLSLNAGSFGTEIPMPTDADYTREGRPILNLLDIPTDPNYRATLRIYGPNEAPKRVSVNVFSESGAQIESFDVELSGILTLVPEPFPLHPAYAQLDPLTPAVRASGQRVRIAVSAHYDVLISPAPVYPLWAFLTVTNNDTQQVTTVTSTP